MVGVVGIVVVGPRQLPMVMHKLGTWINQARRLITDVQEKTGIDDVLRREGIPGGLAELRSLVRGDLNAIARYAEERVEPTVPSRSPYRDEAEPTVDRLREYPVEGADLGDVLPDDLAELRADIPASTGPTPAGSAPAGTVERSE